MNYRKLTVNLERYGRDKGYAYVCSSYRPQLRSDAKYRQWSRLVKRSGLLAMTKEERRILGLMLGNTMAVKANRALAGR